MCRMATGTHTRTDSTQYKRHKTKTMNEPLLLTSLEIQALMDDLALPPELKARLELLLLHTLEAEAQRQQAREQGCQP